MSGIKRYTACIDGIPVGRQVVLAEDFDALQRRLTVAEQRADDMIHALTVADEYLCAAESLLDRGEDDSFNLEPAIIIVRDALKDALKPTEASAPVDDQWEK